MPRKRKTSIPQATDPLAALAALVKEGRPITAPYGALIRAVQGRRVPLRLENLSRAQIVRLQARQALIYRRLCKCRDLVCARKIAELYGSAHRRNSPDGALIDLELSILGGEFGAYPHRRVFSLPDPPRIDESPHPLKVTNGNITGMREWGHPISEDLWLPRAEAVAWLRANGVAHIPTWLTHAAEGESITGTGQNAGTGQTTGTGDVEAAQEREGVTADAPSPPAEPPKILRKWTPEDAHRYIQEALDKDKHKDGKVSARQLYDGEKKWCAANGIEFDTHKKWRELLRRERYAALPRRDKGKIPTRKT